MFFTAASVGTSHTPRSFISLMHSSVMKMPCASEWMPPRTALTLLTPPWASVEIGRAHVCTPVTRCYLVCRLLLEKKKKEKRSEKYSSEFQSITIKTHTTIIL